MSRLAKRALLHPVFSSRNLINCIERPADQIHNSECWKICKKRLQKERQDTELKQGRYGRVRETEKKRPPPPRPERKSVFCVFGLLRSSTETQTRQEFTFLLHLLSSFQQLASIWPTTERKKRAASAGEDRCQLSKQTLSLRNRQPSSRTSVFCN
ncbi:hypothetical protein ATANTOWER_014643 [Ataeniobius toweri]|uniref:Uncharacterized protein n=1 Tax=Ataeniobius toweri TaxID=208326 RepID=A0ABU7CB81_9TELE|nr:hypothetical protein [Ataeniobius toweri]